MKDGLLRLNLNIRGKYRKVPKDGSTLPRQMPKLEVYLPRNPEHAKAMLEYYGFKNPPPRPIIVGDSYSDIRHSIVEHIINKAHKDIPIIVLEPRN